MVGTANAVYLPVVPYRMGAAPQPQTHHAHPVNREYSYAAVPQPPGPRQTYQQTPRTVAVPATDDLVQIEQRGIFIKNLHPEISDKELLDLLHHFGSPKQIRKGGQARDSRTKDQSAAETKTTARVTFATANEARAVIQGLDGRHYKGLKLVVALDKSPPSDLNTASHDASTRGRRAARRDADDRDKDEAARLGRRSRQVRSRSV